MMLNEEVRLLHEIASKLDLLVAMSQIANRQTVFSLLASELDSKQKRDVYELLDGSNSIRDIANSTGVNIASISRWSQRWEKLGLVLQEASGSSPERRRRVFDLSIFLFEK
jgi:Trp operon repressor